MKYFVIPIAFLATMFGACSSIDISPYEADEYPIRPEVGVEHPDGMTSRASGNVASGQEFSISLFRLDETAGVYPSDFSGVSALAGEVSSGGLLDFAVDQYYLSNGQSTRIIAVHPAIGNASEGNGAWDAAAGTVTYQLNGTIDVMATGWGEGDMDNTQMSLTFKHLLSQVKVYIYAQSNVAIGNWGAVQGISIVDCPTTCTLTLPAPSVLAGTAGTSFATSLADFPVTQLDGSAISTPYTITDTDKESAAAGLPFGYCMFAPTDDAIQLQLRVTTEKGGESLVNLSACRYEPGKAYAIYLRIAEIGSISPTVSITDWVEAGVDVEGIQE